MKVVFGSQEFAQSFLKEPQIQYSDTGLREAQYLDIERIGGLERGRL